MMLKLVSFLLVALSLTSADQEAPVCDITNDPDVRYIDIRLPENEVPEDLTTYACHTQKIPLSMDVTYHAVAFEPIIANKDVMHHMILFGCPESHADEPHICGGGDNMCRTFLVQWSMGIKGQICSYPDTGVRFGRGSLKSMALQIHWNNAKGASNQTDSSGVRVYYTTHLKKYDVGNVQIGQDDIEIPAASAHAVTSGGCSSQCTSQWLQHPIYLTRAHLHMHYVGDGGKMELYRNGQMVTTIMEDVTYDYNSPPAHYFDPPVEILPGDEVKVTCYYNTRDGHKARNRTVYWGEGSDGEMCYAFVTYYPRVEHFDQCIQFDYYNICSADGAPIFGDCIFQGFVRDFRNRLSGAILRHCTDTDNTGVMARDIVMDPALLCTEACEQAVQEVIDHPCMQGRLGNKARRVHLSTVDSWELVKTILDSETLNCHD